MKIRSLLASFTLFTIFSLTTSMSQGQEIEKVDPKKVKITTISKDVENMEWVSEVTASSKMPFGSQSSLRKKAREKIRKEAAKLGATLVLIQSDDFAMTPINNVSIVGIAYKEKEEGKGN